MDDNTRQVLVALVIAFGGFLTGVLVAKLGFDHARTLDRERSQREDRHRNRAEKVAAYAAFLATMGGKLDRLIGNMNMAQVGGTEGSDDGAPDPEEPLQAITVLAPAVAQAAQDLYDWSVARGLDVLNRRLRNMGLGEPDREIPDIDVEAYHRLRDRLIAVMHADLGIAD